MSSEPRERWRIDHNIPLPLIFTLASAIVVGIWNAAATSNRIDAIEKSIAANAPLGRDVVQLKEQVRQLERITSRLEAISDRRADAGKTDLEGTNPQ